MKKVLSLILACILMCAVLIPCSAAGDVKQTRSSSFTLGMWPQSRVTSAKELSVLNAKLVKSNLNWIEAVLPNGTVIRYCDVNFSLTAANPSGFDVISSRPTYRAVRVNGSAIQWYRWEPLTWHSISWHNQPIYVCDSLVSAITYSGANPAALNSAQTAAIRAWLASDFYEMAFSTAEKQQYINYVLTPTVSMTQGFSAAVGDYVALSGANGANYFKTVDPEIVPTPDSNRVIAEKPLSSAKGSSTASNIVGVLPIIVTPTVYGGGLINWIMRLFGH